MKAIIGVYESHEKAETALIALKKSGYPINKLSIVGKADLIENHIHIKPSNKIQSAEMSIGAVAGTVLGILTGVGIFAIPGVGFLYGAGALVGALAGFDFGIVMGGFTALLTGIGITEANALVYEKHLNEGNFLVFAQGEEKQLEHAKEVLHTQGISMELYRN